MRRKPKRDEPTISIGFTSSHNRVLASRPERPLKPARFNPTHGCIEGLVVELETPARPPVSRYAGVYALAGFLLDECRSTNYFRQPEFVAGAEC